MIEIKVGRVYRAKKPRAVDGNFLRSGYYNDRQVMWMDSLGIQLQYDGPAVANGRHYPKIDVDKFKAWAGEDVTDKLPPGDWEPFV